MKYSILVLLGAIILNTPSVHAAAKPNILFILTDDQGYGDLSAGMPELRQRLTRAYDKWWDDVYPKMMARGGDAPVPVPVSKGH